MRALVTGGAGFIGSHLVEYLLNAGHEVVALDNLVNGSLDNFKEIQKQPKFIFHQADITQRDALLSLFEGIDWVFHLAALTAVVPSLAQPADYFDVNVTGTLNVLEAARAHGIKKFVYTASCSCYGHTAEVPTTEDAPLSQDTPYSLTKSLGEELVLHWEKVYKLPAISLRLFNVYGPRAKVSGPYSGVIGLFTEQKFRGEPLTITGDGCQTRDFVFVKDVTEAFYAAAQSPLTGEIFNVGSSKPTTILELANLFKTDIRLLPPRIGELKHSAANTSKIKSLLNWQAKVSLTDWVSQCFQPQKTLHEAKK